ncbi:hypothetical protein OPW41_18370 [Vibrio europaeus]|uniref:hypothetical protein n=1 Tax=Vibrio europaeus TaxID=300876 RepID=UPI00233E67D6|nr:hypothetical protein [Vibrio europaeus]MDC5753870.1 hypothetical protein [Vibrio europaeus]MDC5776782.1 hypothetical protein [Vibrio europaeus]MDC5796798.1 hypothetical protein [Vibrio europaeus]MDC5801795.1 hypothetical protein [Vibrio europaeus]MDC5815768.1 hypothetical protein [Vibrio europaeus]
MHPLQNGTQVPDMPDAPNPIGDAGYMTEEGSPSVPGAHYFNAQIKEFENALAAAGILFDRTKFDHLAKAFTEPNKNLIKSLTGMVVPFHTLQAIPGWLDLKGGEISRVTDRTLWDYAQGTGLIVVQSLKDSDPIRYAMCFGTGNGTTTFTLPNHHLGHFVRGNPSGVGHGETQGDAIRPVKSSIGLSRAVEAIDTGNKGVFSDSSTTPQTPAGHTNETQNSYLTLDFDISKVHPVSMEVRPYTANLTVKIHRGWM